MITMIRCQSCKVWFNMDQAEQIITKQVKGPLIVCPFCGTKNWYYIISPRMITKWPFKEVKNEDHEQK